MWCIMSKFSPLSFQQKAIDELIGKFKKLWRSPERELPLLFKSPTGSGKTFMAAHFVHQLHTQPDWIADVCFVWITFSDDLAMQSRDKFRAYFNNTLKNSLLTVQDVQQGILKSNDILFLNWQKVVKNDAATRRLKLRRPNENQVRKESGYYFEDVIEATHAAGRQIVVIIDESHKNADTVLSQDLLKQINPKIIVKITATPKREEIPTADDIEEGKAAYVLVKRSDVVAVGLIKEKIVAQTEENLQQYPDEDMDKLLVRLAADKRNFLKNQFESLGKNSINPLVLIQLPNDDAELKERGEKTKEEIVLNYLTHELNVPENKIALWFDKKKQNLEYIADNDNHVEFMLFKQAAGTGWDCPRASVLVMFREIKTPIFHTQVLGRILRTAEPDRHEDYRNAPALRIGYLFTNYERNKVEMPDGKTGGNKPATLHTVIKPHLHDSVSLFNGLALQSDYLSRTDYGDLANAAAFQQSFQNSMNTYFGLLPNEIGDVFRQKLIQEGVDTVAHVNYQLIVNAVYDDFDNIRNEILKKGQDDVTHALSANDLDKTFNFLCWQLLKEQEDPDAKYGNTARAWATLKSALNVWFKRGEWTKHAYYQVFIADVGRETNSVLRPAITQALKDYRPILNQFLAEKKKGEEAQKQFTFSILSAYSYTEDYEAIPQKLCVLEKAYVLRQYNGRENELKFIKFLEGNADCADWWFKNGIGQEYYGFKYTTPAQTEALFYPDWIIKLKNGKVGIFDTKGGFTLNTEGKAKALALKIEQLGGNFFGGIVRFKSGIFEYCLDKNYNIPEENEWQVLSFSLK